MKPLVLCLSIASALVALQGSVVAQDDPTSQPTTQPTSQPTTQPTSMPADDVDAASETDGLAGAMAFATGNPYASPHIAFDFVVIQEGTELSRRRHDWRPLDGTLIVSDGTDNDEGVTFVSLNEVDPSSGVADPAAAAELWARVAPGVAPEAAADAWSGFINDRFWLFAPSLVNGAGVEVTETDSGTVDVHFTSGGVTPGDRYTFIVAEGSGHVEGWSFILGSGREGAFRWSEPEPFSTAPTQTPFMLSLRRTSPDGVFEIRFENVEVETP